MDRIGQVLFAIVDQTFELFVIAKEKVTNDDSHNLNTNEELVCVLVQIKVMMQCVGRLNAPIEILFLLVDQHPLVLRPRCHMMPLVVTTILEWGKQLREIFDVAALFALPPRDTDLDHISVLVQAEQAPNRVITMSIR